MRIEELPSPGPYSGSARLRIELAKAISYSEIGQLHSPNKTPKSIIQLINFLEVALAKANELVKDDIIDVNEPKKVTKSKEK